jgi:SAM-dependent methyltransferase
MTDFYQKLAKYYDQMYSFKDYEAEASRLHEFIQQHKRSKGNRLLDVACGTGGHLQFLKGKYEANGLDVSEVMLAVAKEKMPEIPLYQGSMVNMSIDQQFDVITCLFGSIGYLTTLDDLIGAIQSFSTHLVPGGVVLIEPMFTKETVKPDAFGLTCVDLPEIKIARAGSSAVDGDIAYLNFHFLLATKDRVEHFVDPSPMGVFPRNTFLRIMEESGLETKFVDSGLSKEGLFIGVKI